MNGGVGCQHIGLECRPEFKPCPHIFSFEQETLLDFVLTPHPPEGLSLRFLSLSGKVASLVPQIRLYLILFNPFSNSQRPVDVTAAAS